MPHDLFQDRMAFVGETPWHRLGTEIPPDVTAAQMISAANLDWEVQKEPAPGARMIGSEKKHYDRYVMLRDPVGEETEAVALAIVGKGYEPLQNIDAFKFFEPFVEDKWAIFHTAGALGNGERVWVLARLNEQIIVGENDAIDRYLLLSNSHDGSGAVTIRFTPIRVVCQNTLNYAKKGGKGIIAVRHTRHIRKNLAKAQAKELKRVVHTVFQEAETLFGSMAMREIRAEDVDRYLDVLFPRTKRQKARNGQPERWFRIKDILDDEAVTPRETRGTLWALYNAVVRDEDFRATREATADARLERVWFGRGQNLKLKALALARRQLQAAA